MTSDIKIIPAELIHLKTIVELLANDQLGASRENVSDELSENYLDAFHTILQDPNQHLVVLISEDEVIGTLQLTFIPYLTYQGGVRAQIEAVRIKGSFRGHGLGKTITEWAINLAKEKGAHLVQLTSDKQRPTAIEFYKSLGFNASHEGMKLHL